MSRINREILLIIGVGIAMIAFVHFGWPFNI
jgi:hypothetical protein